MVTARDEAFMKMAQEIAQELDDGVMPSDELLDEAYMGLAVVLHDLGPEADDDSVEDGIREYLHKVKAEYSDLQSSEDNIIAQVEALNRSIDELTKELGTRPNLDELANDMGISQEKVISILKLLGEDVEQLEAASKETEWSPQWKVNF
ncbi:MAG: sigma-70 domain-containing protein [Lachnospiraceae bacterium]|nr:sigma-70 domain-containing protein [Lachnospiraceae bacterium]